MRIVIAKEALNRRISLLTSKLNIELKNKLVRKKLNIELKKKLVRKIGAEVFGGL